MGLKCSFLGHSYEEAGVEREREEQGSEVVTVVKELEQCRRCGEERVVSESTEVTAVVDADEVEADVDAGAGGATGGTGGFGGAVDRAMEDGPDDAETLNGGVGAGADGPAEEPAGASADERAAERAADEAAAAVDELAEEPEEDFEPRDPEEEDAEILTDDDDPGRDPGEWPDDPVDDEDDRGLEEIEDAADGEDGDEGAPSVETELDEDPDEETLSGITVPEGRIACPECGFEVDAESSYRDGDPCPECGAWLTTVAE